MTSIKASLLRAKALYTGFVAGAPAVDNSTLEVSGQTLRLKDGGITRQKLATATKTFEIPLTNIRGTTGLIPDATLADSVWAWLIASNVLKVSSNAADSTTKTAAGYINFVLPPEYVSGQNLAVKITTQLISVTGTGVTNNGSDIDCEVYRQVRGAGQGGVGSDLCTTAAQTYAALDTVYEKSFTIDGATLVAGDRINIKVTGRAIESNAGNGTIKNVVHAIAVDVPVLFG